MCAHRNSCGKNHFLLFITFVIPVYTENVMSDINMYESYKLILCESDYHIILLVYIFHSSEQVNKMAETSVETDALDEEKNRFQFPSSKNYELLKSILQLHPGDLLEGISASKKKFLQEQYEISTTSGNQIIINRSSQLPLLLQEEAEEKIEGFHSQSHSGARTTYQKIKMHYHHVPLALIEKFVRACNICRRKRILPRPPVGKPIVCNGILHRIEIDLIDLSHTPDGEFKYILQVCILSEQCPYSLSLSCFTRDL